MWLRRDFEPEHLWGDAQTESGWIPCVWGVKDFAGVYLFRYNHCHIFFYTRCRGKISMIYLEGKGMKEFVFSAIIIRIHSF